MLEGPGSHSTAAEKPRYYQTVVGARMKVELKHSLQEKEPPLLVHLWLAHETRWTPHMKVLTFVKISVFVCRELSWEWIHY